MSERPGKCHYCDQRQVCVGSTTGRPLCLDHMHSPPRDELTIEERLAVLEERVLVPATEDGG